MEEEVKQNGETNESAKSGGEGQDQKDSASNNNKTTSEDEATKCDSNNDEDEANVIRWEFDQILYKFYQKTELDLGAFVRRLIFVLF